MCVEARDGVLVRRDAGAYLVFVARRRAASRARAKGGAMTCLDGCGEAVVTLDPVVIEAPAPSAGHVDAFVVLFCALFASVCGTWVASRLAGANVDDGGEE